MMGERTSAKQSFRNHRIIPASWERQMVSLSKPFASDRGSATADVWLNELSEKKEIIILKFETGYQKNRREI